jgi:hypothetical protein
MVQMKDIYSEVLIDTLLDVLDDGWTIFIADFVLLSMDLGIEVRNSSSDPWRYLEEGDTAIYGDPYTKLKSVYDPNAAHNVGWFRPLTQI